jgi:hypothetical protein
MNSDGIFSLLSTRHKSIVRHGERVNAQDASGESTPDLQLEIAYLLLIDDVGYSKLLVNEQVELLQELNRIVRSTECLRAAKASGKLTRVPTGDGMALLFFAARKNRCDAPSRLAEHCKVIRTFRCAWELTADQSIR